MMLSYNHNIIIKTAPFVKPVKPQQIVLLKSKCTQGMCSTMHSCLVCKINDNYYFRLIKAHSVVILTNHELKLIV